MVIIMDEGFGSNSQKSGKEMSKKQMLNKKTYQSNKSEQTVTDGFKGVKNFIFSIDKDWNIIYDEKWSILHYPKKKTVSTRFDPREFNGKNFWKIFPWFVGTEVEKKFREAMSKRKARRFECKSIDKDGFMEFAIFPSSEGITVHGKDITRRKRAERVSKENKDKFRSLVESTSDWIWQINQNYVYTYSSPKVKEILGYDPEEIVGKTPFDLMPKDEAKKIAKLFREIARKKEPFHGLENWNIHKNGSLVLLETSGVPLLNNKGLLVGYRGIDRDITERKKAEDELKQSEERFSKIFHSNPSAIVISCIRDGRIIDVNKTFLRLSGYTYEEVLGHTSAELNLYQNPADRTQIYNLLRKQGAIRNREMTFRMKSGELKEALFSTEKIRIGNEDCIISTALDVTERKKLEKELEKYTKNLEKIVKERTEKLKDAERLAAIGATAGMLGHDIRNPLQTILGELYLAFDDLNAIAYCEEKESLKESLMAIQKRVDYIDKIVSDLQDFCRPIQPMISKVDLKVLIEELLFKAELPENVDASCQVDEKVKAIMSDVAILERALGNLILNAVQAMPDGGELTVHAYEDANDVVIAVQDTGVGVPEALKGKLFTPLFTTKSKGQGFGLAAVKRLVESLGGSVSFESTTGKGSTFKIRFSITDTVRSKKPTSEKKVKYLH